MMMRNILVFDKELRLIVMTHLDKELSRISSRKTKIVRKNYNQYYELFKIDKSDDTLKMMDQYRNEMNENNLGLEHIFREIGKAFEYFTSEKR